LFELIKGLIKDSDVTPDDEVISVPRLIMFGYFFLLCLLF
jgi:hypothetical protein